MSHSPSLGRLRFSLGLGIFLAALGTSSANVALPQLAEYFAVSFASVQWVVLAYLLSITVLIVLVGRLSDLYGAKRLLLAGVGLFALASVWCAVSQQFAWLVTARAVQGVGAAVMMSLCMALVPKVAPADQAPRWIGFLASMSAIGTALGPACGGLLLQLLDWRSLFLLNVPCALFALVWLWQQLPADHPNQPVAGRFDHMGACLLAMGLLCYALSMTVAGDYWPWLLTAAAGFAGGFVFQQQRLTGDGTPTQRQPLLRLALFRQPTLRNGFLLNLLVMTVMMTTLVVGPFYLAQALGLSALAVGAVMAVGPMVTALTAVPLGALVQRYGSQPVMAAALMVMSVGALNLALVPLQWAATPLALPSYMLALVILTLGYATFQTSNNSAVMTAARPDERGVIAGLLHLARNLGQLTGAAFMGAVFAWAAASQQLHTATAGQLGRGLTVTFGIGSVMLFAACVCLYWHTRRRC